MLDEKIKVRLSPVQETLLLPLWARALESQAEKPIFHDPSAVAFMQRIDYDFDKIEREFGKVRPIWAIRAYTFDHVVRQFRIKHAGGTVVNLGAGLDTTFFRMDNGKLRWYDLDLPESINLRRQFIDENQRLTFISADVLDPSWLPQIECTQGEILFMAAGLLFYLELPQIQQLFNNIAQCFPKAEFIFDFIAPRFVKPGGKYRWGMEDAAESLTMLHPNLRLIQQWRFYDQFPHKWNWMFKLARPFVMRWNGMVHARFEGIE
ncbi:MAG: class I SAM-dependent methyltransferase [Anaerolineales bacterium]